MNKTLFQITDEMYQLIEYGCNADGEIAQTQEEFNLMFDQVQLELTTKIDNTNGMIKILEKDAELIDVEIKRLQALKKNVDNKAEWMKSRIDFVIRQQFTDEEGNVDLEGLAKYKLKLPHSVVSYRKSETTEVKVDGVIPNEYKTVVVKEDPDKKKIKELLKTLPNEENEFAYIKKKVNISIK